MVRPVRKRLILPTVCPKCGSFNENNWLPNEKRNSYFWEEFDKNKIRNTAPTIDALLRIYGKSFLDDLSNIDTKNKKQYLSQIQFKVQPILHID